MKRRTALLVAGVLSAGAIVAPAATSDPARADAGVPKVAVIVLENEPFADVYQSASAPYLNSLVTGGLLFTDYHAMVTGSAPNYRAMTAGVTAVPPPLPDNIFRAFDQSSHDWTELEESMTGHCGATNNAKVPGTKVTLYTTRHDPAFTYRGNESCATHNVPLTSDAQLTSLPAFSYIVPNECDDMHTLAAGAGCPSYFGTVTGGDVISMGDHWLAHVVPLLLSDPDVTVIITFDEGEDGVVQHVFTVEVGAGVDPGTIDDQHYTHYGLLAGLYAFYGLGTAPNGGASATPLPIAPDVNPRLDIDVEGGGSVSSDPSGIACGTGQSGTCATSFTSGTPVTLSATPDVGATFDGWGGDCSGTGDCLVTMDASHSVRANFGPTYTLTVDPPTNGSLRSDVGGIDCPGVCSQDFFSNTAVTLTPRPDPGYEFSAWGGDCAGVLLPTCPLTMDTARAASVTFAPAPQEALSVAAGGTATGSVTSNVGGIDCPGVCSTNLDEGQAVTLTAHPGSNAQFTGWAGDCTGPSPVCHLTMDGARSATATFDPAPNAVTIDDGDLAVGYDGWRGVVDPSANGGGYQVSDVVNAKATWKSPRATSVIWMAHVGPDGGKAGVSIDGKSKGILDLYAPSPGTLTKTFAGLTSRIHTVIVKVTNDKNPLSDGKNVSVDAFKSGTRLVSESDPSITYDTWTAVANPHALDGGYRATAASSATVSVTFSGTAIDWIACKGPTFGKAAVSIDNVAMGTVDLYMPAQSWQLALSYAGLSAGPHTLLIDVLGVKDPAGRGAKVCVDGFTIHA